MLFCEKPGGNVEWKGKFCALRGVVYHVDHHHTDDHIDRICRKHRCHVANACQAE